MNISVYSILYVGDYAEFVKNLLLKLFGIKKCVFLKEYKFFVVFFYVINIIYYL